MMDKNEIITLSSDDESDSAHRLEYNSSSSATSKNSTKILKSYSTKIDQITTNSNVNVIIKSNENKVKVVKKPEVSEKKFQEDVKESPELVDLVDSIEKPNDKSHTQYANHESSTTMQVNNHSKLDIICIDESPVAFSLKKKSDVNVNKQKEARKSSCDLPLENIKINEENIINSSKSLKNGNETEEFYNEMGENKTDEDTNENLKFFTEFVEFCGSLEKIPNDRARLTKKLMKRYGEADWSYIKSQEFRNLIQKCKNKINTYNLYLIAKEITDELSYRKKLEINTKKPTQTSQVKSAEEKSPSMIENNEKVKQINGECKKNRAKFIKKIVKKLDKLGSKIRELEAKEVDLSDEEESSYVQLQRYRERFCQIYVKLCKYTNEVADADRFYSRKICFTESKYPAINKCIENWLNKTKTFPDFSDIMKLLESQSSTLGLPSNRESIRMIATEIFQQVGAMLQRRRMYDLWDSFCGFLDEGEDPAHTDPTLDKVLKSNFEARIKKEQEIFKYFAELQEKERLEPEEVPDEEANHSPVESGNEDHKEIEDIENCLIKKLDDAIKKETEEKGNTSKNSVWGVDGSDSKNKAKSRNSSKSENTIIISKESKNNFRNCKSLKWRLESGGKMASVNSEEWNVGTEKEKGKEKGNLESGTSEIIKPDNFYSKEEYKKPKENEKNFLGLDFIPLENIKLNSKELHNKIITETIDRCFSPLKKPLTEEHDARNQIPKKKKCISRIGNKSDFEIFNINDENDSLNEKTEKVFNVHCCQIFTDNVFENLNKKERDWGKRKVFRDLTNVNRLMALHGKRKKMSALYSPSFFPSSFCKFEKSFSKKRFKASFRFVGLKDQKCALNQEEKSGKTINSGKGTGKKGIQNNSKSGRNDEGQSFFSNHGNGSEEDNNEDKNKKNGRSTGDLNENQFEEEEEEEENEAEKDDNKIDSDSLELFFPNKKTEGPLDMNPSKNSSSKNEESIQFSNVQSKTTTSSSKSETENKNKEQSEKILFSIKPFSESSTRRSSERKSQKNDYRFHKENRKSKSRVLKNEIKEDGVNVKGKDEEEPIEPTKDEEEPTEPTKDEEEPTEPTKDEEEPTEPTKDEEEPTLQTKSMSKIVRRNLKANVKNYTMETKKSNLVRQKAEVVCSEVASNEKLNASTGKKIKSNSVTQLSTGQSFMEVENENELIVQDERKKNICSKTAKLEVRRKTSVFLKKKGNEKAQIVSRETAENKSLNIWKSVQLDMTSQKFQRKNTPTTSDEERVKRFLMCSPASISITPPRKFLTGLSKPPSQAALQALATLRNLKGISATIVRSKPKDEDDVVVIGCSYKNNANQDLSSTKRLKTDDSVISNVQSIDSMTPKIVTVQGNVSDFEKSWPEMPNSSSSECSSSSLRISNVWGNLPHNFLQYVQNTESLTPGCSSQQSNQGFNSSVKKKNTKKTVEYVVLE